MFENLGYFTKVGYDLLKKLYGSFIVAKMVKEKCDLYDLD